MPKAFDDCVAGGGRVRTKTLSDGRYLHICFPKDGGAGIAGEVKQKVGERLKAILKGGK
mgnify:CR=1 FL=1